MDDDDFNENDAGRLRGDMGEDVTGLDLSLLQATDSPEGNVFAPAYVRIAYDLPGNQTNVPFKLNMDTPSPGENDDGNLREAFRFDFIKTGRHDDPDFWVVYLLGAYQEASFYQAPRGPKGDGDPNTESRNNGRTDTTAPSAQGAVVFLELIRPGELPSKLNRAFVNRATTAAHEIGHTLGGEHTDGGLMAEPEKRNSTTFSDKTIKSIRTASNP